jgi:acetylornithine deacetylase
MTQSLTADERAALDAVDTLGSDRWTQLLADLIAIPSITGTAAEGEAQRWVAEQLSALGCDVDHWRIDLGEVTADPDFPGMELSGWATRSPLGLRPASCSGAVRAT